MLHLRIAHYGLLKTEHIGRRLYGPWNLKSEHFAVFSVGIGLRIFMHAVRLLLRSPHHFAKCCIQITLRVLLESLNCFGIESDVAVKLTSHDATAFPSRLLLVEQLTISQIRSLKGKFVCLLLLRVLHSKSFMVLVILGSASALASQSNCCCFSALPNEFKIASGFLLRGGIVRVPIIGCFLLLHVF